MYSIDSIMLCLLSFMPCCLCVKESASYYIAYFLELTQQKKNREIVKESASYYIAYFLELAIGQLTRLLCHVVCVSAVCWPILKSTL